MNRKRCLWRKPLIIAALLLAAGLAFSQAHDTIAPNENLVAEGIPPIPRALADEVNRYTEFRSAGLSSWHPTRREILISTRFADTNQVHEVKQPMGARTQLTFFADRVASARYPRKGTGEHFTFSKDIGGGEWFQIYRYDRATGKETLLTDGKSRNSSGQWSSAGDKLAYTSTRRNNKDTDLYVVAPADPKTDRRLAEMQSSGWSVLDWSPDDKQILMAEYISANESYLWIFDAATGQRTELTPRGGEKVAYGTAEFSEDGKGIYLTSDQGSEFQRLAYMDLASRKVTPIVTNLNWDVEEFELSPDGKTIAFTVNENGMGVLHLLDTATRRQRKGPQMPVGIVSSPRWHSNSRDLGFEFRSARAPTDVYSMDVKTGKVERWTRSETGGLNTETFSQPELVTWTSFDGKKISGYLYLPPAKFRGKRPVVISIHGGPEGQFRPSFLARTNYYLNELGIAVIYPNVRGSSGYGKTFLKLDNGYLREDSYKDIAALLDWIPSRPELDAQKIMVTGGSYGGFMTLAVATNYNDRICCSLDVVGISNMVSFLEKTESYRRDLRRVEYGDERDPKMRAFLERIAPVNHAHKITKPIFIVQGKNDPRVPLPESEQMVATIRKNNTPVWYLMAKDEGHGFAKKKNQDFQFYATVMFMKQFLLDQETQRARQ